MSKAKPRHQQSLTGQPSNSTTYEARDVCNNASSNGALSNVLTSPGVVEQSKSAKLRENLDTFQDQCVVLPSKSLSRRNLLRSTSTSPKLCCNNSSNESNELRTSAKSSINFGNHYHHRSRCSLISDIVGSNNVESSCSKQQQSCMRDERRGQRSKTRPHSIASSSAVRGLTNSMSNSNRTTSFDSGKVSIDLMSGSSSSSSSSTNGGISGGISGVLSNQAYQHEHANNRDSKSDSKSDTRLKLVQNQSEHHSLERPSDMFVDTIATSLPTADGSGVHPSNANATSTTERKKKKVPTATLR